LQKNQTKFLRGGEGSMMVQPAEAYVQKDSMTALEHFLEGQELADLCLSRLTEINPLQPLPQRL
jgi:hypothetical protein